MSASDALQPGQFFHGTTADLAEGDEVLPASKVGRGRGKSVWLATHPDSAESWAHARAARDGHSETEPDGWTSRTTVPVHVYEVAPHGLKQDRNGWHKADKAVVTRRLK